MKPLIGIIGKQEQLKSKNKIMYTNLEINEKIIKAGGIPLQINMIKNLDDTKSLIDKVQGVILQGGNDFTKEELKLVKYLHKINKPTLGICLGMQTMVVSLGGKLKKIKKHNNKYKKHKITINKTSKLYEIIRKEKIIVNTRHTYAVKKTSLDITAKNKNIIEAIEDKNKLFFIGVQYHPESINNEDSDKLFNYFIGGIYESKKTN